MTNESEPHSSNGRVCSECVGDSELRRRIEENGSESQCTYCGQERVCSQITDLAEWVGDVFFFHYTEGDHYKTARDEWRQRGDWPEEIVGSLAGVDLPIAQGIVDELVPPFDPNNPHTFDPSARYVKEDLVTHPFELHETWREFCERIRFGPRFFAEENKRLLEYLLTDVEDFPGVERPVEVLRPGEALNLFRARVVKTERAAQNVLANPAKQLGPPPPDMRKGGRLNAPGVSTFYGAFSADTCIAEVRPVVGGLVVVGSFRVIRELNLLDLTAFQRHWPDVSIFAEEYEEVVQRWRFLRDFDAVISQPVQPHEEFLEYVPTQAVAEFFQYELGYDGLIYSSAQRQGSDEVDIDDSPRAENRNVALFDARGIVEGVETAQEEAELRDEKESTFGGPFSWVVTKSDVADRQLAEPALSFDEESAKVHRVTSVAFDTERELIRGPDEEFDF